MAAVDAVSARRPASARRFALGAPPVQHEARCLLIVLFSRDPCPNCCHEMTEQDKLSMSAPSTISPHQAAVSPPEPFWVFGYGSLMWRPGFRHLQRGSALLTGYHRRLCVTSRHHRGTAERPGLVMGLDRGGACRGAAYRVPTEDRDATLAYLDDREIAHYPIYRRAVVPVLVQLPEGTVRVRALTYVVDRAHSDYSGHLSPEAQTEIVRGAVGISGPNPDYIAATLQQIHALGLRDARLEAVQRLL
jgi:cation transport protein ChaC